ncbi:MAG: DUF2227 family putative metal-binding protein [Candidatus Bipolaricaulia bacterium]
MPSGKQHLHTELILLPVVIAGLYLLGERFPSVMLRSTDLLFVAGAYLLSSLLLSPDLDLRYNLARRRWGLLGVIWIPYIKLFKHRHLSHHLFFGPLSRIVYLLLVAGLVLFGLYRGHVIERPDGIQFIDYLAIHRRSLLWIVLGLYLPNALHILYDRIHSWLSWLPRRVRRHRHQ